MIIQKEFLNQLKSFGLNSYESKIWTALLSRGVSTAGELSDIANVPRSRSYDVLESLEKKGFVVMKFGKPIKYLAVPPEEVVERVKKNMRREADVKVKRLEEMKGTEVLDELKSLHKQGIELVEITDLSGSLRGRHNLYNHLDMVLKNAKKSVTIMSTAQGMMRKLEGLKPTLEKIKKRGVKIRVAGQITKDNKDIVKSMLNIAEIRHTDAKARFAIVDGRDLTFMVLNDSEVHPTYDVGVWVTTPFFASALEGMFNDAWDKMKPAAEVIKKL